MARQAKPSTSRRASAVLILSTLLVLLLPPGTAAAAGSSAPVLAITGFNVFTPVLIGLVLLVVGLAVTGWAFLRKGSARRKDRDSTGTSG